MIFCLRTAKGAAREKREYKYKNRVFVRSVCIIEVCVHGKS